ncbi:thioredoxin family protein [Pedobacter sp. Leaf194]|uniref:DUF1223 domain-containing protein n=1 Tax=Pedobacter sp. Leaf194 TaxID=1736297 RepID=UPI0007032350|nr:DUF1223 domain-containing protein [Pedobacter sp. Leaf194]KQS36189.1 hypothetical protein ASG14_12210 [Pedobacter sp. Leaf194]
MFRQNQWILYILLVLSVGFSTNSRLSGSEGFAVVELFTSEGCSSCPPADELIAKIHKEYTGRPVYILGYHVDYWDRLGWKDKFSNVSFSKRQHQYAHWLNLSSVYTPQIVVNGTREFIGSEESTLRSTLQEALSQPSGNQLELSLKQQTAKGITLTYHTVQQTKNENLVIAIVNPYAVNKIERGENQGRTLSHIQIVTYLETFNIGNKVQGDINLLVDNSKKDQQIVAFLQNTLSGQISSASNIDLKAF